MLSKNYDKVVIIVIKYVLVIKSIYCWFVEHVNILLRNCMILFYYETNQFNFNCP